MQSIQIQRKIQGVFSVEITGAYSFKHTMCSTYFLICPVACFMDMFHEYLVSKVDDFRFFFLVLFRDVNFQQS